uniref:Uncharacterized protein n=1 Tax=Hanusia phi TaxID=3032 RepID=A0A7S0EGF9_9CRYP|mmetsp:Transcript_22815/g.51443  ORF Transcript_22815/g.51443 Transcript_22815/m.51443 type:complete len:232 (+) Transcript_22815:133-828(+)
MCEMRAKTMVQVHPESKHARRQSVEEVVESMPLNMLAQKGRVLMEPIEPFFITSVDGPATALLGKSSSRITGRMLRSIDGCAGGNKSLCAAARKALNEQKRVFLTFPRPVGEGMLILAFQPKPTTTGSDRLELLIFPTQPGFDMVIKEPLVECMKLPSEHSALEVKISSNSGRDSPDKDLEISDEEMQDSQSGDELFDYNIDVKNAPRHKLAGSAEIENFDLAQTFSALSM